MAPRGPPLGGPPPWGPPCQVGLQVSEETIRVEVLDETKYRRYPYPLVRDADILNAKTLFVNKGRDLSGRRPPE